MVIQTGKIAPPEMTIEVVTDPQEIARSQAQHARFGRNLDWLESHWNELLPHARGRFVAVAHQQAFVADSADDAWAWIRAQHPDDNGGFVQYVPSRKAWRIYANYG